MQYVDGKDEDGSQNQFLQSNYFFVPLVFLSLPWQGQGQPCCHCPLSLPFLTKELFKPGPRWRHCSSESNVCSIQKPEGLILYKCHFKSFHICLEAKFFNLFEEALSTTPWANGHPGPSRKQHISFYQNYNLHLALLSCLNVERYWIAKRNDSS